MANDRSYGDVAAEEAHVIAGAIVVLNVQVAEQAGRWGDDRGVMTEV